MRHDLGAILDESEEISIHAPLTGCDCDLIIAQYSCTNFNPRTPDGVRQWRLNSERGNGHFNPRTPDGVRPIEFNRVFYDKDISIHAPLTGCDFLGLMASEHGRRISIHAPLTGCDRRPHRRFCETNDFNPRTPDGVRPRAACLSLSPLTLFQSTHP